MTPSAFDLSIYELTRRIPSGCVTTYGELARAAGCGSARAVGQALRRNPFAPEVPCHRVIAADLKSGGFQGERAGKRVRSKLALLESEGVAFKDGRLADPARLFRFTASARRSMRQP
jgi:methylated-DNA-[protein]-cysteine S-methyltransferase